MASDGKCTVLITHPELADSALQMLRDKGYELRISQNAEGYNAPSRDFLLKDVKGVDAILWFGHTRVDQEMIEAAGDQLKVVGSMGAGYDHLEVGLLYDRNIKVSNTPDVLSRAVADMAIGLALAVSRNILKADAAVRQGNWMGTHPTWMCGPSLEQATVGVVGLGSIGKNIVQRIKSFDTKEVVYSNRRKKPENEENGARYVELDELLEKCDFVFLTVPKTKETKHLIAEAELKKMKKTAVLINCARGDVVRQDDLIAAIKNGEIGGAGLDVTDPEPLPTNSELLTFDNVVITPHIAGATYYARERMAMMAAQNIINGLEGRDLVNAIPRP